MKIIKSKTLGYCHGVASTLKKAQYCIEKAKNCNKNSYSIGNLIHNPDVVKYFSEQGLEVISDSLCPSGVALIRAHGIADKIRKEYIEKGFDLVDATCVNILHTKEVIKKSSEQGRKIVLLGVPFHAETECLIDTEKAECFLVSCEEDLSELFSCIPPDEKVTLVTQTTFPKQTYDRLSIEITNHYRNCIIGNGLCPDCIKRKNDGKELACSVDAVVVIGGKNSENTKDLANCISDLGKPVYMIENIRDIDAKTEETFKSYESIGICSGTSTPMDIIDRVCEYLACL